MDFDGMIMDTDEMWITRAYEKIIRKKYPEYFSVWPIVSGYNYSIGYYSGYTIYIFKYTGNTWTKMFNPIELNVTNTGVSCINFSNIDSVREKIYYNFGLTSKDSIVIVKNDDSNIDSELLKLLERHEYVMGVKKMKIFLSHKTVNKPFVRKYKEILDTLGFDVWLDEDAMPAGTEVHRGILQGFKDSCAAVFFITPQYKDEGFLATEINYAMTQKNKKGDKFAIIPIVFKDDKGNIGEVPELLQEYVYKKVDDDLQGLQEIVRALPIKLGEPRYR